MSNSKNIVMDRLRREIEKLPSRFQEDFSFDFVVLLALLRLHGFSIQHADEGKSLITDKDDLWLQMGHPSICLYSGITSELVVRLRRLERDTPEYIECSNEIIRANLEIQRNLVRLLEKFYAHYSSTSFYSRLIVETIDDLAESCLKSQGSSVRVVEGRDIQRRWLDDSRAELLAFGQFLSEELE